MRRAAGLVALMMIAATCVLAAGPASASQLRDNTAGSTVTKTGTATRSYISDDGAGSPTTVSNKISLTVAQTTGLKSLQQVQVSWSGAHVTDGTVYDVNSDYAQNEEYSFDLFECRGVDSTTVPAAQRISPDTCWTQYADERFQGTNQQWPAWRSDSAATIPDRQPIVDAPSNAAADCSSPLFGLKSQRWVPFNSPTTSFAGGPADCAGQPPEANPVNLSSLSLPSNETYGVTTQDGTGSANFTIFTDEDHASLGCSSTVPCSLVAIPIEGLSCDAAGTALPASERPTGTALTQATQNCNSTGSFTPGESLQNVEASGAPAVDGSLWWSASNWKNRISVPLSFAPADNECSLFGGSDPVDLYGSELLAQATTSWAPHFCLNPKLFTFEHVQTPEPEARNLLATGNIEAALSSDAPDTAYPTPTVEAPVAVTGFGIAYDIDDANGKPVTNLRLDARLIAKLLTESYPDQEFVKSAYPDSFPTASGTGATLSNNPLNLASDPEFQALNPNIPVRISDAEATLLIVNSDSDVISALTSYINADPAARAFLDGDPDPWGMRVNPFYQGIKLPVDDWPLLDTFEPTAEYQPGRNDCLAQSPSPYLPLVASPTSRLFSIGQDMEFAIAQSQTTCVLPSPVAGDTSGAKLVAAGRQAPGFRFMLGLVTLGDAARDNLHLASLETSVSASAPTKFSNGDGQTFAAPTTAGLAAAASTLTQDPTTHAFPVNYTSLRLHPTAYPGTMVVYAQVPTTGVPKSDAVKYGELLDYAAGAGQVPGDAQGELPGGFLPMTAAYGLSGFAAYTKEAATAVAAQQGGLPEPPSSPAAPPPGDEVATSTATTSAVGTLGNTGSTSSGNSATVGPVGSSSGTGSKTSNSSSSPTSPQTVAEAETTAYKGGFVSWVVPALLIVALLGAVGSAALWRVRGSR